MTDVLRVGDPGDRFIAVDLLRRAPRESERVGDVGNSLMMICPKRRTFENPVTNTNWNGKHTTTAKVQPAIASRAPMR
jgi:hypothetical protein